MAQRNFTYEDTIAAISTPVAVGGIGIIRISGKDALQIVSRIFKAKKSTFNIANVTSHTLHYGHIYDTTQKGEYILDEVLVSFMLGPNTYTKEDVVEINSHGGVMVMKSILAVVLKQGARIAEPGEFTKRAFLNGRIDLTQAEAVMDIIHSKTEMAVNQSVKQLEGSLKVEIEELKQTLLELIAHIEASIDYPEYDIEELTNEKYRVKILNMLVSIEGFIDSFDNGRIVREGIKTSIIGRPNVGKSSILNALLRENRAIVTDIPGTTRDTLEEYMNVHGIPLRLIDTAGIRDTDDVVESIGVTKSYDMIKEADLVLFILDSSIEITDEDIQLMKELKEKNVIIILNKIDLERKIESSYVMKIYKEITGEQAIILETSATEYDGLHALETQIKDMFMLGEIDHNNTASINNVRQKNALLSAKASLEKVLESINAYMSEDIWAIDLQDAYQFLQGITGEHVDEDIINQIFSQFCLGK